MKYTLETYRVFPYVAWFLVIGFALFTYALTIKVQQQLIDINTGIEELNAKVDGITVPPKTHNP